MFKFITHRPLWLNILTGILLAVAILFIFIFSLNWITHHNQAKSVPSVQGKSFDEATEILESAGFEVVIQDSIYIDTAKPLKVIKQVPEPEELVKVNRTVYLTINRAVPPMVEMPNIVGYSFRSAEMSLKNSGLNIGDTSYRPDFAKNSVLEQRYNGQKISEGTRIRMGSSISLVLGDGVGDQQFVVPNLIGMTYAEARSILGANGIGIGAVLTSDDVEDTASAYIYDQNPKRYNEERKLRHIRSGQLMDLWLQRDLPVRDTFTTNPE
jgi:beta-lactam-binding protein with PASTA domain